MATRTKKIPLCCVAALTVLGAAPGARADGKIVRPVMYRGKPYKGSLEEKAQEAIIIFKPGRPGSPAKEDLILKISVEGEVSKFGWVIPFPTKPETAREDPKLFKELYDYVRARMYRPTRTRARAAGAKSKGVDTAAKPPVQVLSRKVVGNFDVAVVRENQPGALNGWLKKEGFQTLEEPGADKVVAFYRKKGFVFACIKVSDAALSRGRTVDLHPLRFTFRTGGRDGIYYPMKMTGLQTDRFDVNLYVFYDKWINDRLSKYGFVHRGFRLRWRDYDSRRCKPNEGKNWAAPRSDPYLRAYAYRFPTVTAMFKRLHPEGRFYLTNVYARGLDPAVVRNWPEDLWFFPYYTDPKFVPYDARPGGPARGAYGKVPTTAPRPRPTAAPKPRPTAAGRPADAMARFQDMKVRSEDKKPSASRGQSRLLPTLFVGLVAVVIVAVLAVFFMLRKRRR